MQHVLVAQAIVVLTDRGRRRSGVYSPTATSSVSDAPILQFDWRISPDRIRLCTDANAKFWELGSGGYGTARPDLSAVAI